MSRSVLITILCEDRQQECFARRFLMLRGYTRHQFRVELPPAGSGEQWVRERFPVELQAYRHRSTRAETRLLVITDADVHTLEERLRDYEQACTNRSVEPRHSNDRVACVIPARNIESWLAYLSGEAIDEATVYPKLRYESDCQLQVETLHAMCKAQQLREPVPASLQHACREFSRLEL